jgi:hypothetical protein
LAYINRKQSDKRYGICKPISSFNFGKANLSF